MKYTKEELIPEVVKARIAEAQLKKATRRRGWLGNSVRQQEYQGKTALPADFHKQDGLTS